MEREFWIQNAHLVPSPIVAVSRKLPLALVKHLLYQKSSRAVKQKYGHKISPLQGACHSLVVPLVFPSFMGGITNYRSGKHVIDPLPPGEPPFVVISALVQPDFEFKSVMYSMIQLENEEIIGKPLNPNSSDISDIFLKRNFVYHFAPKHKLPAVRDLSAIDWASKNYIRYDDDVLSLSMLRNIVREQIRVEMSGLDRLAKSFKIKLVYTWDSPSIFAACIGINTLDQTWFEAVTHPGVLSEEVVCIAFNDYANKTMIPNLRAALTDKIHVCAKSDLQLKPGQFKVLHTNSDAFGQHIRTQSCHTSLDGAIGSCSSAAASLTMKHPKSIEFF